MPRSVDPVADRALTVVKIGGSLISDPARLRSVLAAFAAGADGPVVIVPGGGPFADTVRATQTALGFDEALAHRLALGAMSTMAEVFRALEPQLHILRTLEAVRGWAGHAIWDPDELRAGHPDIPETWDVTSDSLAVWLATELRAARCILVKSASCPPDATPGVLARLGLVDPCFPDFAGRFMGEILIRGATHPRAVARSGQHANGAAA